MKIETHRRNYDNFRSKILLVKIYFEITAKNIIDNTAISTIEMVLPKNITMPLIDEVVEAHNEIKNLLDTTNSSFTRNSIKKDWSEIHDWLNEVYEINKDRFKNNHSKEAIAFNELQLVCFNFYGPIIEMIKLSENNVSLDEPKNEKEGEFPKLTLRQAALYAWFNNEKITEGNQNTFAARHQVSNKAKKLFKDHYYKINSDAKTIYQHKNAGTDLNKMLDYFTNNTTVKAINDYIKKYDDALTSR